SQKLRKGRRLQLRASCSSVEACYWGPQPGTIQQLLEGVFSWPRHVFSGVSKSAAGCDMIALKFFGHIGMSLTARTWLGSYGAGQAHSTPKKQPIPSEVSRGGQTGMRRPIRLQLPRFTFKLKTVPDLHIFCLAIVFAGQMIAFAQRSSESAGMEYQVMHG